MKRVLSLILALMLIISCFAACSGIPDTPHAVMTYEGRNYYYGMEIDVEKLLSDYPDTIVSGATYSISNEVSVMIREIDGKNIVVGYFVKGINAKLEGITVGDSQKKYLTNFENSSEISNDGATSFVLGFYFYNGKRISHSKFYQYYTASRFEGNAAHEKFLDEVIVSTALSNGTIITSLCYGDYRAIYDNR